jgi:hypothetical protein
MTKGNENVTKFLLGSLKNSKNVLTVFAVAIKPGKAKLQKLSSNSNYEKKIHFTIRVP